MLNFEDIENHGMGSRKDGVLIIVEIIECPSWCCAQELTG